jgi:hypothetical protein
MSESIKVDVTTTAGGLLVKIKDPRWTVKATAGGILIKPIAPDIEEALTRSLKANDPSTILALLRADLRAVPVARLRAICRKAGISRGGRKVELIERIVAARAITLKQEVG